MGFGADSGVLKEIYESSRNAGGISLLESLCNILKDSDEPTNVRINAATSLGYIYTWIFETHNRVDLNYLSKEELLDHEEKDNLLSSVCNCLKLSMKTGPLELRDATVNAYLSLPFKDDSDVMKAFSEDSSEKAPDKKAFSDAIHPGTESSFAESLKSAAKDDNLSDNRKETEPEQNKPAESQPGSPAIVKDIRMQDYDLDQPVEIAPDTYWVGTREGSLLERNIYLRVFSGRDKTINLLIDPGPPEDLTPLVKKLSATIGGPRNIHAMFLNHQDPDVSYNAGYLQKLNPNNVVLCSEDSWRLVKFYGLNPSKYKAIEQFRNLEVDLKTGHHLQFVPSPYCHFRGATMLYDKETGILFTGDFLGGLSFKPDLFASKDSWNGISTFHQIYMPSQAAMRHAVSNIRSLETTPDILAPQHGSIITGDLVDDFLTKIEGLEVGLDLFLKEHTKENYIAALNELLVEFASIVHPAIISQALSAFRSDGSFPNAISVGANAITAIKVDAQYAIDIFLRELRSKTPEELLDLVDICIVKTLTMWKIPIPDALFGEIADQEDFFSTD